MVESLGMHGMTDPNQIEVRPANALSNTQMPLERMVSYLYHRCDEGTRACAGDLDCMRLLMLDIPVDGHIVKLGSNCMIVGIIIAFRPDINVVTIDDNDGWIDAELRQIEAFAISKHRFTWKRACDGLLEASKYHGPPIDCLILDSNFTTDGVRSRIEAWLPLMAHPSWLVMHDWRINPRIAEAVRTFVTRYPDLASPWSGFWRFA